MGYKQACFAIADTVDGESDCQCEIPCQRVDYESKLSYSQLSKFNIARNIIHSDARRSRIMKKFKTAKEVAERVVENNVQENNKIFGNFISIFNTIYTRLSDARHDLINTSFMAEVQQANDIRELHRAIQMDAQTFRMHALQTYEILQNKIIKGDVLIDLVEEWVNKVGMLVQGDSATCLDNPIYKPDQDDIPGDYPPQRPPPDHALDDNEQNEQVEMGNASTSTSTPGINTSVSLYCAGFASYTLTNANKVVSASDISQMVEVASHVMTKYNAHMDRFFINTSKSPADVNLHAHQRCILIVRAYKKQSTSIATQLYHMIDAMQTVSGSASQLNVLKLLIPITCQLTGSKCGSKTQLERPLLKLLTHLAMCDWIGQYSFDYYDKYNTLIELANQIEEKSESMIELFVIFQEITRSLTLLIDSGNSKDMTVLKYLQYINDFMENNATKLQTAELIGQDFFKILRVELTIIKTNMFKILENLNKRQTNLQSLLSSWPKSFMSSIIPPYGTYVMGFSEIINLAKKYPNDTLKDEVGNPETDVEAQVKLTIKLFEASYRLLIWYVQQLSEETTCFLEAMDDVQTNLAAHQHTMVMDTAFYL